MNLGDIGAISGAVVTFAMGAFAYFKAASANKRIDIVKEREEDMRVAASSIDGWKQLTTALQNTVESSRMEMIGLRTDITNIRKLHDDCEHAREVQRIEIINLKIEMERLKIKN